MNSEIAALFLDHSTNKLDQMEKSLGTCLGKLTDAQIWRREAAHENAIGNLVLHLCGNMRQWIMHGVGREPSVRRRDEEFSASGDHSAKDLLAVFHQTLAEVKAILAGLPHERLTERINPQTGEISVLGAIYTVVGHVEMHMGQIILLTKHYAAQDLDLTIPRPR